MRPSDPRRLSHRASLRCRMMLTSRAVSQLACCTRRCQSPGSRTAFRPFVQERTAQVRPCATNPAFRFCLTRYASERRIRTSASSRMLVPPSARQALRMAGRAAKHDQDTEELTDVESFFSTFFRPCLWGKEGADSKCFCQFFRKMTEKLFAGISTTSSRLRKFFCASGAMSRSRSRTPQRASRDLRL